MDEQTKAQVRRELMQRPIEWLRVHRAELIAEAERTRDVCVFSSCDSAKVVTDMLKERLDVVLSAYVSIDARGDPSEVVARLAEFQGKEKEIRGQLGMWFGAKNHNKALDEKAQICEEVLAEKQDSHKHSMRR